MFNRGIISFISASLLITPAFAAVFPDVPDGHVFQTAVEDLAAKNVIKGNPDGKFYPDREVNRAEMLILLYRATGKTPSTEHRFCFKDVEPSSWYEAVVCDAAANGYVNGYADGTFKPAQTVNRVEALKMIATVFEFNVDNLSDSDKEVVKFVDVSTAAWYTKYLFGAYHMHILPIPGQDSSRFEPEKALTRGEAAAYIYNAMNAYVTVRPSQSSSSVATQAAITVPFEKSGVTNGTAPAVIEFTVSSPIVATTLATSADGDISCRLYLLGDNGLSSRYYLGYEEGTSCRLLNALDIGSYQLEVHPHDPNLSYAISTVIGSGDGNDGFREASFLPMDTLLSGKLSSEDLKDWYTFSLQNATQLTLNLGSQKNVGCIVYPMEDVDLDGFQMPSCNTSYLFPRGTYYVAITRTEAYGEEQDYSLILQASEAQ